MVKLGLAAVVALVVSLVAGCETGEDADFGRLPNLVGTGLQAAQDKAQAAGYVRLRSHDALGQGRTQVLDRNWKVCTQRPKPGELPLTTSIDFGAVKLDEECPAREPRRVHRVMLNLVGKTLREAIAALPDNASVQRRDVSGRDRIVLVDSNWQVCGHTPRAGARYRGQPVTLHAVKVGETCP